MKPLLVSKNNNDIIIRSFYAILERWNIIKLSFLVRRRIGIVYIITLTQKLIKLFEVLI